ncbi:unnamed protein product, partial [Prorocentrum cordatum]
RGLAAFCPAGRAWPAGPRARPPRRTGACGRHASFGRPGPLPLMANNVIDVAIRGVGGSSSSSSGKVAVKLDPSNVAPQAESRRGRRARPRHGPLRPPPPDESAPPAVCHRSRSSCVVPGPQEDQTHQGSAQRKSRRHAQPAPTPTPK